MRWVCRWYEFSYSKFDLIRGGNTGYSMACQAEYFLFGGHVLSLGLGEFVKLP